LEYLKLKWSLKAKTDFMQKPDKSLKQVQKFPDSCPKTDSIEGLQMLLVTKQTSMFYRFDSKNIKVVTIFDNGMNPEKLKKEAT